MNGQVVGYARVSTDDQNMARQLAALDGVDKLFTDELSGKSAAREGLQAMLSYVREGDTIRTKSIDRLARSASDLLDMLDDLQERGVSVEFLDTPYLNTASKEGRFFITVLGALAELERATIRERQAEGIAIAKANGKYDRAPKLDGKQVAEVHRRVAEGVPKTKIAKDMGVSRQTVYNVLSGRGVYKEKEI